MMIHLHTPEECQATYVWASNPATPSEDLLQGARDVWAHLQKYKNNDEDWTEQTEYVEVARRLAENPAMLTEGLQLLLGFVAPSVAQNPVLSMLLVEDPTCLDDLTAGLPSFGEQAISSVFGFYQGLGAQGILTCEEKYLLKPKKTAGLPYRDALPERIEVWSNGDAVIATESAVYVYSGDAHTAYREFVSEIQADAETIPTEKEFWKFYRKVERDSSGDAMEAHVGAAPIDMVSKQGRLHAMRLAQDPETSTNQLEAMVRDTVATLRDIEMEEGDWRVGKPWVKLAAILAENPALSPDDLLSLMEFVPQCVGQNIAIPVLLVEMPTLMNDMIDVMQSSDLDPKEAFGFYDGLCEQGILTLEDRLLRNNKKTKGWPFPEFIAKRIDVYSQGFLVVEINGIVYRMEEMDDIYHSYLNDVSAHSNVVEIHPGPSWEVFWSWFTPASLMKKKVKKKSIDQIKGSVGAVDRSLLSTQEGRNQALRMAEDPATATDDLVSLFLLPFSWETREYNNWILQRLAENPSASPELLKGLMHHHSGLVGENPALSILLMENPNLLRDLIREIEETSWDDRTKTDAIKKFCFGSEVDQIIPWVAVYDRREYGHQGTRYYGELPQRMYEFSNGWVLGEGDGYFRMYGSMRGIYAEFYNRYKINNYKEQQAGTLKRITEPEFLNYFYRSEIASSEAVGAVSWDMGSKKGRAMALQMAQDPRTPTATLEAMTVHVQAHPGKASDELASFLAQNPAASPSMLLALVPRVPSAVGNNAALAMLYMEDPGFIHRLLETLFDQLHSDDTELAHDALLAFLLAPEMARINPRVEQYVLNDDSREDRRNEIPVQMDEFTNGLVVWWMIEGVGFVDHMADMFDWVVPPSSSLSLPSFLRLYDKISFEVGDS